MPVWLIVVLAVLPGVILPVVLVTVLLRVAAAKTRELRARFEQEGVLERSGDGWLTLVAKNYRGPGLAASAMARKGRGEVLLTRAGLHAVGVRLGPGFGSVDFGPDDLKNCRAWIEGDRVHLATAQPPHNAKGEVEIRFHAPDTARFLAALRERGVAVH